MPLLQMLLLLLLLIFARHAPDVLLITRAICSCRQTRLLLALHRHTGSVNLC
jgi:hypothetical protein